MHNFVQARMAKFFGQPIEPSPNFFVLVGSGEKLRCEGVVTGVPLTIQGCDLTVDFYVLQLHGADMVLGVSWLATLGLIVTDYAKLKFEFEVEGNQINWQGELAPAVEQV